MSKKIVLLSFVLLALCTNLMNAQDLLRPFESISRSKSSYFFMQDGTEIEGTVKRLKKRKGLIKYIRIKTADGKKQELNIGEIQYAYLPQNLMDKIVKVYDFMDDAQEWVKGPYDKDRIKKGYAIFESTKVIVKGKERTMLMQLLNPHTANRMKVFHDPGAHVRTFPLTVGGITVMGNLAKSYYISKDGAVAYKLKKKKYKRRYKELFSGCNSMNLTKRWSQFGKMVTQFNTACGE